MCCSRRAEAHGGDIVDAGDVMPAKVAHYSGYTSAETSVVALPKHLSDTH